MVTENLTVKDIIGLFESELRNEEQFIQSIQSFSKDELANYITEDKINDKREFSSDDSYEDEDNDDTTDSRDEFHKY